MYYIVNRNSTFISNIISILVDLLEVSNISNKYVVENITFIVLERTVTIYYFKRTDVDDDGKYLYTVNRI